jgi:hypothetical protein
MAFPLEFKLSLIIDNLIDKPEVEKYMPDYVDFIVDTSSYYG